MSGDWLDIRERLLAAADAVEACAADAAKLVADLPFRDPDAAKLDPRKSQVEAAKFAAGLDYEAGSMRSRAERIKLPTKPKPDQPQGER